MNFLTVNDLATKTAHNQSTQLSTQSSAGKSKRSQNIIRNISVLSRPSGGGVADDGVTCPPIKIEQFQSISGHGADE